MDNLANKIAKLCEISLLTAIDLDNPKDKNGVYTQISQQDLIHMHLEAQTHLLAKMLEILDNINEKLDMMNINIQDVEQEVSKLNPRHQ